MVLAPLARRGFLGRLAALPILGVGSVSIFARRADAAAGAIMRQIDEAERRCTLARQAFDEAHTAFEAALPRLHWTLDMTPRAHKSVDGTHQRRPLHKHKVLSKMECGFAGEPAKRYDLANLCKAIFEHPATTLPAIRVQARVLCAYTKAHATPDGGPRAGFYGMQVAASLDRLAA